MDTQLCTPVAPERATFPDIAKLTGNYYLVLGALTLSAMPICYLLGHEFLDGSFILWFWLGACLKGYSRGARNWALFLAVFVSVSMLFALTSPSAEFTIGSRTYSNTEPEAYLISAALWSVFAIPAILLLTRNGRDTFSIRQEYFRTKAKAL